MTFVSAMAKEEEHLEYDDGKEEEEEEGEWWTRKVCLTEERVRQARDKGIEPQNTFNNISGLILEENPTRLVVWTVTQCVSGGQNSREVILRKCSDSAEYTPKLVNYL